jgi:acyl carrier protein
VEKGLVAERCLIVSNQRGPGDSLANLMEARGTLCSLIDSNGGASRLRRAVREFLDADPTAFYEVVYLSSPEGEAKSGCDDLLNLTQALVESSLTNPPRMWIVTQGAQPVQSAIDLSGINQGPVWGMARVIAMEHPELRAVCVDLDHSEPATAAQELFQEICAADGEERVAIRRHTRYAARLSPLKAPASSQPFALREDGTYLITGGLGGLGLLVAKWMIERGARNLVLLGRNAPSRHAEQTLEAFENAGAHVVSIACDVSRADDLNKALAEISRSLPPLRGIIHAAGILDDGVVLQQTPERFARVGAPKVHGAWNLHSLTTDMPLDFFVLFSSAAAVLGSPGQSNYAAANGYLDGLASYRRSLGLPALSIGWGPWKEAGMASAAAPAAENRWAAYGVESLTPERGLEALESSLSLDLSHVVVMPVRWSQAAQNLPPGLKTPFFSEVIVDLEARLQTDRQRKSELRRLVEAAPPASARDIVSDYVRRQVLKVMDLQPTDAIDERQPLNELGLDSLMAVELKNVLGASVDRTLSAGMLFYYPTVQALAEYLATSVLGLPQKTQSPVVVEQRDQIQSGLLDEIDQFSEDELNEALGLFADQHLMAGRYSKGSGE